MTRFTRWLFERRWRIVAAGVLIMALPLLTFAFTVSIYVSRVLEERLVKESGSLTRLAAHTLEQQLKSIIATTTLFNKRPILQSAIRSGDLASVRINLKRDYSGGIKTVRPELVEG